MDRIKDMASSFNPADVQKYLKDVNWPIGKDDLVRVLKSNGAPSQIIDRIQGSNESQFGGPQDVTKAAMES